MIKNTLTAIALVFAVSVPALAKDVMDVADLVEKEGPAVVNISTTTMVKRGQEGMPFDDQSMQEFFRRFFPGMPGGPGGGQGPGPTQEVPTRGEGSGFIVSNDGYILTNAHVVKGADEVVVKLIDKRTFTAKVIGADARTDVAVIKITARNLPTVKLGDPTKLRVGEAVAAIGSPFGFENSVTAGIVSAKDRSLPSETYVPFIQTDVPINPGNSGGPLFNMKGEVVGINSQIYSRSGGYQGVSFAIPIDVAMEAAAQLKSGGKVSRGWLGVVIQEVTADLADSFGLDRPRGALVSQVQDDSPARKAGLQAADVILEFNGKAVENSSDLPRIVGMAKPGTRIPLQVWRKGKIQQLSVVLGELPVENQPVADNGKSIQRGGLSLSELGPDQRRALDLDYGVLVADVTGEAARAGIRTGDIILAVNNTRIASVAAYRKAVAAIPAGKSVAVLVRRGDGSLYVPLKISGG
ncbi:MAG: protease Do [Thiobacillus sp. 63-78]|uniref:DegQ family serine endoprotease n=1 Tax=Thiobacillus sp. 63-78 TaxID=1895859 RepID=UPI00095D9A47|nr:DegQ family serine endoprotease [Thiobacillus sp. 63-78]MBN8762243.1 DegQ family serine endoprotease [Thiobacillus sp.]MBN8774643.1 DegQ family serine endoprotease [Thiobacillus sp.]OJZ12851.1 MAG: protease Do [Thiobacillus sp. 63-78]